ncbi:hypothetical protein JHK82_040434 [Glycine max]|nr:hypothetical protein JHK82_040434 [Glycine max]KAG5122502.1 hypothetical protein JHK84_040842 [Glycine max]
MREHMERRCRGSKPDGEEKVASCQMDQIKNQRVESALSWPDSVIECSIKQLVGSIYGDVSGFHGSNNNGFASSGNSIGNKLLSKEELVSFSTAFESSKISDPRLKVSKMSTDSIFALEELDIDKSSSEINHHKVQIETRQKMVKKLTKGIKDSTKLSKTFLASSIRPMLTSHLGDSGRQEE